MTDQRNNLNALKSSFDKLNQKVKDVLSPLTNKWKAFIAPLSNAWDDYARKNPRESKIFSWIAKILGTVFGVIALLFLLVYMGVFGHIPSSEEIQQLETANATEIYTQDGKLIGKYYVENRTTIALDSISPYLITALLAIEDKRFFEHSGVDLRSWMRVFKGLATQSQLGGGSTLSQQLAKNLFPRKNYYIPGLSLFINKIRENIISIKLENAYNKEELLIMYLNTVPFGGNRFGIQEASRYFYNKRPKKLEPDEAATLIGMLKATTALDPTRNPENSKKRRNLVLSQMLKNKDFRFDSKEMTTISQMITQGAIDEKTYEQMTAKPITAKVHEDVGNNDGIATYFREYLRTKVLPNILKNLLKSDGTPYNLYTDGLKITTTLDSKMQTLAETAVFKHMSWLQSEFYKHWKGYKESKPWGDDKWIDEQVKKSDRYQTLKDAQFSDAQIDSIFNVPAPMKIITWGKMPVEKDTMLTPLDSVRYYFTMLNCGFMAMDYKNGYVKSWVGGTDFKYFKFDHILSKRQVGSTFKPIVYSAALMDSISPCKFIRNDQVTIKDWSPRNSDESYGGWYSVIGGLTYSVNVIVAQLIDKVGIQKTLDLAEKMGVTSTLPREYGISLGAADISLYDMMKVFGTIANKGVRPEPVTVLKIEDRYGNVIYDYQEEVKNDPNLGPHVVAMDTTTAATMTRMMQSVIVYGTGNNLRSRFVPHGDFAGKTGTTQNHADGWFIAFNPDLVTGAWVGGSSPAVRFRSMNLGSGAAMALPIVGNFWYSLAIDKNFAKLTQDKFPVNESVNEKVLCPFRIGISPDTLNMLMQDTIWRDSLTRSGFKNLRQIVTDVYGYPDVIEPEGGESDAANPEEMEEIPIEKDKVKNEKPNPHPQKEKPSQNPAKTIHNTNEVKKENKPGG
ncbi:MAG: transglycosylase domain-containing protein [Saprospiraceae bacterium]|nr:transglycosylase domain-containing protein [Saprospiraceae bacterium]